MINDMCTSCVKLDVFSPMAWGCDLERGLRHPISLRGMKVPGNSFADSTMNELGALLLVV